MELSLQKIKIDVNMTHLIPTVPVFSTGTIAGLRQSLGNELSKWKSNYKETNKE